MNPDESAPPSPGTPPGGQAQHEPKPNIASRVQGTIADAGTSYNRSLESFVKVAGEAMWWAWLLDNESTRVSNQLSQQANQAVQAKQADWSHRKDVELRGAIAAIDSLHSELSDAATAMFDESEWDTLSLAAADIYDAVPDGLLRVGRLALGSSANAAGVAEANVPCLVPHLTLANLHVSAEPGADAIAVDIMHSVLLRMLSSTPNLIVDMVDAHHNGVHFSKFSPGSTPLIQRGAVTESDIRDRLQTLSATISDVSAMKLRGIHPDITSYNRAAKEEGLLPEPHRLLAVMNPDKLSRTNAELLAKIQRTGTSTGVAVLSVTLDISESSPPGSIHVFSNGQAVTIHGAHVNSMVADAAPSTQLVHRVVDGLAQAHEERVKNQKIELERVLQTVARWSRTPNEAISTPVGMVGEQVLELGMHVKGGDVHALIVGQTGSGKSSLLHAIIMGLAHCYSPDDVQFLLIDGKGGVEMRDYAKSKAGEANGLPHARIVAIESDVEMYVSVLEYLSQEMARRNLEFKRHGVTNVVDLKAKNVHLPRLVAVLDEFHVLLQDTRYKAQCVDLLTSIAKQGRSYGIHMVLSTQSLAGLGARGENKALFDNLALKIAFRCDDSTSEDILGGGDMRAARITTSGAAYVKRSIGLGAGDAKLVQVGFESAKDRIKRVTELDMEAATHSGLGVPSADRFVFGTSDGESITTLATFNQVDNAPQPYPRRLWLGSHTTVGEAAPVMIRKRSGGNIILLGGDRDIAVRLASAAILGMASSGTRTVDIVSSEEDLELHSICQSLTESLANNGVRARLWRGDLQPLVDDLQTAVAQTLDDSRLLVVLDLNEISSGGWLGDILKAGPENGVHSVIWARTMLDLLARTQATPTSNAGKILPLFDVRVEFDLSVQDKDILGLPRHPSPDHGKAVLWTAQRMGVTSTVIPFTKPTTDEIGLVLPNSSKVHL